MATINPYLNFAGNTEEAFAFYKSVFGGEFLAVQRFGDLPGADGMPIQERDKIMHIALPIGRNTLMATDMLESMGQRLQAGNNLSVSVEATSDDEARKIFNRLSSGGAISTPFEKMVWGAYFGMLTDKFGVQWMVNYDANAAGNTETVKDSHP